MTPPWSNAHQETSTSDRVKRLKEESFERENEWSNELALITYRIECLNKLTMGFFIISTYRSDSATSLYLDHTDWRDCQPLGCHETALFMDIIYQEP